MRSRGPLTRLRPVDNGDPRRSGRQSPARAPRARPPAALEGKVFRGTTVVAQGLLTAKQLRSSPWRRLRQDVYADARLPVTHRLLISAVGLVLPDGAAFGGRSAAVLWGIGDVATADDPVEVLLPPDRRWNPGSGVRCRHRSASQRVVRRGRWSCSSRIDTAIDLVRFTSGDEAVVLLDHLVHLGLDGPHDVPDGRGGTGSELRARPRPPCRPAGGRSGGISAGDPAASAHARAVACRLPWPSSSSVTAAASSGGSTSPFPTSGWRSSTTGSTTQGRAHSSPTDGGSNA